MEVHHCTCAYVCSDAGVLLLPLYSLPQWLSELIYRRFVVRSPPEFQIGGIAKFLLCFASAGVGVCSRYYAPEVVPTFLWCFLVHAEFPLR
jgi:hypothetical protein